MGNFYELFPLKQEKIGPKDERAKTLIIFKKIHSLDLVINFAFNCVMDEVCCAVHIHFFQNAAAVCAYCFVAD